MSEIMDALRDQLCTGRTPDVPRRRDRRTAMLKKLGLPPDTLNPDPRIWVGFKRCCLCNEFMADGTVRFWMGKEAHYNCINQQPVPVWRINYVQWMSTYQFPHRCCRCSQLIALPEVLRRFFGTSYHAWCAKGAFSPEDPSVKGDWEYWKRVMEFQVSQEVRGREASEERRMSRNITQRKRREWKREELNRECRRVAEFFGSLDD